MMDKNAKSRRSHARADAAPTRLSSEEGTLRWHWSRPLPFTKHNADREENGAVIDGGIRSHIEMSF